MTVLRCPKCRSKRLRYHEVRTFSQDSQVILDHNAGGHAMLVPGRVLSSSKDQHDHADGDDQIHCLGCDEYFDAANPDPFITEVKGET